MKTNKLRKLNKRHLSKKINRKTKSKKRKQKRRGGFLTDNSELKIIFDKDIGNYSKKLLEIIIPKIPYFLNILNKLDTNKLNIFKENILNLRKSNDKKVSKNQTISYETISYEEIKLFFKNFLIDIKIFIEESKKELNSNNIIGGNDDDLTNVFIILGCLTFCCCFKDELIFCILQLTFGNYIQMQNFINRRHRERINWDDTDFDTDSDTDSEIAEAEVLSNTLPEAEAEVIISIYINRSLWNESNNNNIVFLNPNADEAIRLINNPVNYVNLIYVRNDLENGENSNI